MNKSLWTEALGFVDQKYIDLAAEQFRSGKNKVSVVEVTFGEMPAEHKPVSKAHRILAAAASAAALAALVISGGFLIDYVSNNKIHTEMNGSSSQTTVLKPESETISEPISEENAIPTYSYSDFIPVYEETDETYVGVTVNTAVNGGRTVNAAAAMDGEYYFYVDEQIDFPDSESVNLFTVSDSSGVQKKTYKKITPSNYYNGITRIKSRMFFTESGPVCLVVIGDFSRKNTPDYLLVYYDNDMNIKKTAVVSSLIEFSENAAYNGSEPETYRMVNISGNGRYLLESGLGRIMTYDLECSGKLMYDLDISRIKCRNGDKNYIFDQFTYLGISNDGKRIIATGTELIDGGSTLSEFSTSFIDIGANPEETEARVIRENTKPLQTEYCEPDMFVYFDGNEAEWYSDGNFTKITLARYKDEKIIDVLVSPSGKYIAIVSRSGELTHLSLVKCDNSVPKNGVLYDYMPFSADDRFNAAAVDDSGKVYASVSDGETVLLPNTQIIYNENSEESIQPFDADVPLFTGMKREWNEHNLLDTLIPDFTELNDNSYKISESDAEIGKCTVYSFSDGRELGILGDGAYIQYYRDTDNISDYGISRGAYGTYYGYSEKAMRSDWPLIEYDDFKSSQAVETADGIVNKLRIPNLSSPMVFSCESDITDFTLSLYPDAAEKYTEEELAGMKGNKAYCILYTQTYDDVKLPANNISFEDRNVSGYYTTVEFIIDKNGVVSFHADNVMELIPHAKNVEIYTFDDAFNAFKNDAGITDELSDAISWDGEFTYISNLSSDGTYSFLPVWKFIKRYEVPNYSYSGKIHTLYQTYFYDAVTAERLK